MNMSLNTELTHQVVGSPATHREEVVLPTPAELKLQMPASDDIVRQVDEHRQAIRRILQGSDTRTLIVMGPCSIHDEVAALEYGEKLKALADEVSDRFLIVMRAYLEKPRTTVGWKGLLYDPERTGAGDLHEGLRRSRRLLLNLAAMGLPLATEALSPFAMDYLGDLVSWTAIGARTTESQVHREMVSGLPMPTGFKNGTDGGIAVATNAMKSASHPHHHLGVSATGAPVMITTRGNPDTNYDAASIEQAVGALAEAGLSTAVMVDCSHDNACKQSERQLDIAQDVMAQRRAGHDDRGEIGLDHEGPSERLHDDHRLHRSRGVRTTAKICATAVRSPIRVLDGRRRRL